MGVANVLLGFVEQNDCAGQLLGVVRVLGGVTQEYVFRQADELRRGEVAGLLLKLLLECRPDFGFAGCEVLVPRQDRLADAGAHPEVGKLLLPRAAVGFDVFLHLVEGALPLEPEDEPGDRVLLGQAGRAEDHAENRLPDTVVGAGEECAGGGEQAAVAATGLVEFGEVGADLLRHLGHDAAGRGAVGERRVGPEVGEHLEQVALAAAEEAANPDRLLRRVAQVAEVLREDAVESAGKLPLADEHLQLAAQFGHDPLVGLVSKAGLAVVDQRLPRRVDKENVFDGGHAHGESLVVVLLDVLVTGVGDRDGEVVPAITGVEEPVVVLLEVAGEEDHEPAADVALDGPDDL